MADNAAFEFEEYEIYKKGFLGLFKSNTVALRINRGGMYYNSFLGDLGLIPWVEMEKIWMEDNVIKILLKNKDSIYNKLSRLKQKMVDVYYQKYEAHIIIFSQQVNFRMDYLFDMIERVWKENK